MSESNWMPRLVCLRQRLFVAIAASLAEDGHCKGYEGRLEIVMPDYFQDQDAQAEGWGINLHCYVIGPSRHYEWRGKSVHDALDKAESDILAWCAEYEPHHHKTMTPESAPESPQSVAEAAYYAVDCWAYGSVDQPTISQALAENRVVKITPKEDGKFDVLEMCDEYFGATLTAEQLAEWGRELIALSSANAEMSHGHE